MFEVEIFGPGSWWRLATAAGRRRYERPALRRGFDPVGLHTDFGFVDLDLLVDLSTHTKGAKPGILALKPARVQITHVASAGAVRRGLAAVRWPARVELIETRPYTIVDMGHNPASMAALRETLQELLGGRRLVLVFGMLETKDYRTVTAMIAPLADAVVTTTPDNPHALPAAALAAEVRKYTARVTALPDRRDAVEHGRALAGPEDVLVVTGSVYLVGEAREWLRRRKPAASTRR